MLFSDSKRLYFLFNTHRHRLRRGAESLNLGDNPGSTVSRTQISFPLIYFLIFNLHSFFFTDFLVIFTALLCYRLSSEYVDIYVAPYQRFRQKFNGWFTSSMKTSYINTRKNENLHVVVKYYILDYVHWVSKEGRKLFNPYIQQTIDHPYSKSQAATKQCNDNNWKS